MTRHSSSHRPSRRGGATIDEVAASASVSKSTVSRVFSHPELVNEGTRQHVLEVAKQLTYRPRSPRREAIRTRTGVIGVVVPEIANPYFQPFLQAVQEEALAHRSSVFVSAGGADGREAAAVRAMAPYVDGLALVSSQLSDAEIIALTETVNVVAVNREVPGVPAVILSSGAGMVQAVEHLAALGHRQLAYVAGSKQVRARSET